MLCNGSARSHDHLRTYTLIGAAMSCKFELGVAYVAQEDIIGLAKGVLNMTERLIILKDIPDVKWTEATYIPICREHGFELEEGDNNNQWGWQDDDRGWARQLRCLEGPHIIDLPENINYIRNYIDKKIKSKQYSDATLVDLDGLLVPVSKKEKVVVGNTEYFLTSQVKTGQRGDQVVIYAGKKGAEGKTQIFIDPEHKRISFDQNDLNPTDIFVRLEATFRDGTSHTIQSVDKE